MVLYRVVFGWLLSDEVSDLADDSVDGAGDSI